MKGEEIDTEEIIIQESLKLNYGILAILGLWVPTGYRGTVKRFVYGTYSAICIALFAFLPVLSELIYVYMELGEIENMAEGMSIVVTQLNGILKVYTGLRHRAKIQSLFDSLQEPIMSKVRTGSTHWVRSAMRKHFVVTLAYLVLTLCGVTSWAIFPFLNKNGLQLPVHSWYPVDETISPWFTIIFVHQIMNNYYLAVSNVSYDTLLPWCIGMACGQVEVLCDKLRRAGAVQNDDGETRKILVNCVQHHLKIIRFIRQAEEIFETTVFMQFFASCVTVCFVAFKLTVVPTFVEFFATLMYMMCMLVELYIMCYFGNELIIKSERLSDAAYRSMWYESSLQNRKYIFIIMERAKRSLSVTAVIFTLSIDTFVSVLRTSYSYFAVLQQVNNR